MSGGNFASSSGRRRLVGLAIAVMLAAASAVIAGVTDASAAMSLDQATAQCRAQFAPPVRACVRAKMIAAGDRSPDKYIPGCRATVAAQFRACIAKLAGVAAPQDTAAEQAAPAADASKLVAAALSKPQTVPPRTISDITAILDQEKPDPVRLAKMRSASDAEPPANADPVALANFYFGRARARADLGRSRDAIADATRAIELATGKADQIVVNTYRQTLAAQLIVTGETKLALGEYLKIAADGERSQNKGFLFVVYRQVVIISLLLGDFDRAQAYVQKTLALWQTARAMAGFASHGGTWEASVEDVQGRLAEARGQIDEALRRYQRAEQLRRSNIEKSATAVVPVPRSLLESAADDLLLTVARVKSRLGRLAEAETDARRALLNRLKATGKYNPQATNAIAALGRQLIEQGRYDEATRLISASIAVYGEIGVAEDSQVWVRTLHSLATVQALQSDWTGAGGSFAAIDRATKDWESQRRTALLDTHALVETLYHTQKVDAGLAVASRLFESNRARLGEQHPDTVLARAHYAAGLAQAGRDTDALKEFAAAVPLLTATAFNTDSDDVINAAARTRYIQVVVESYIGLLARTNPSAETAGETFRLADTVRGRAVQKALTASGARMNTSDMALAAAVRQEQDLRQQIGAQLGQLNRLLALPASERDAVGVAGMQKQIETMRTQHAQVRADLDKRFPDYADLIDPKPPTAAQIKDILRPGEALLSFYFGRDGSFVWAISKDGPIEFARIGEDAAAIEAKIAKLREALEPQAAMVSDIPRFDLASSHELYKTLLEPVKGGWQNAKSLIVVTNGALGLLPLGLLTVAPHDLANDGPMFAGYRAAPWLARSHAVAMVPSASALRTLRRLPPGSDKREKLIAFGDPYFSPQQAVEAAKPPVQLAAAAQTRGIPLARRSAPDVTGVDSASLALLPRLPDTADELKSIALALQADPAKALHLGKRANEQVVKTTNLSGFKVVVFATHGLVSGEIDGLTEPALALSAPSVAGVDGDGLLTMSEILSLKLDADWVVLSACNTGAAAGVGAEAASGLGRAFFYAGTRAILVTNWSVHSQSARELVTDLFRRQAADAKLSRAEALQQAMLALLDGKGFTDDKSETVFAYAHPLFWAPYSIIGDGGTN